MAVRVTSSRELGQAIGAGCNEIEISDKIWWRVRRIKALGKVGWGVAIGSIGTVIAASIVSIPTGYTLAPAAAAAAVPAIAILGVGGTTFLIGVGVAAGSVGAVSMIYNGYELVERNGQRLLVKKTT